MFYIILKKLSRIDPEKEVVHTTVFIAGHEKWYASVLLFSGRVK